MPRQGITPVVAIVLLLMMTVAAAGGAYTWVTGIIGQGQEQGTDTLNREITVRDVSCDTNGDADIFLSNTGSTTVDGNSMTYYLYNVSTGSLVTTASAPSLGSIDPGSDTGSQTVGFGSTLTAGLEYRVEVEFDNEDGYSVEGTCQAQSP